MKKVLMVCLSILFGLIVISQIGNTKSNAYALTYGSEFSYGGEAYGVFESKPYEGRPMPLPPSFPAIIPFMYTDYSDSPYGNYGIYSNALYNPMSQIGNTKSSAYSLTYGSNVSYGGELYSVYESKPNEVIPMPYTDYSSLSYGNYGNYPYTQYYPTVVTSQYIMQPTLISPMPEPPLWPFFLF